MNIYFVLAGIVIIVGGVAIVWINRDYQEYTDEVARENKKQRRRDEAQEAIRRLLP